MLQKPLKRVGKRRVNKNVAPILTEAHSAALAEVDAALREVTDAMANLAVAEKVLREQLDQALDTIIAACPGNTDEVD